MASISTPKTGDQALDLFHTRLKAELDPLLANLLVQGNLVPSVILAAGNNQVAHKLQRVPYGCFPVYQTSPGSFFNYKPSDKNFIYLNASGSFTVSLWTF